MARKFIIIAILFLLYDRVEFLYYAFEGSERKIGFIIKGDPIRIDSYVYFASIGLQQVIASFIIYLLLPWRSVRLFVIASAVCFVEYFFTYGQPLAKIFLPFDFYVPVSASALRFASVCYVMYECVKKALNGREQRN
jgi:hypothetical protein